MQWVYDIGWQATVKKEPKNVVAVMSGSLKSYFYFVCRTSTAANSLQQDAKTFCVVRNGEDICQDFTFRAKDEAVMLVLSNINIYLRLEKPSHSP